MFYENSLHMYMYFILFWLDNSHGSFSLGNLKKLFPFEPLVHLELIRMTYSSSSKKGLFVPIGQQHGHQILFKLLIVQVQTKTFKSDVIT